MNNGWIKLHRKIEDSQVFADPNLLKLWVLCLLSANHKEGWFDVDGIIEPIQIVAGQFITGRFSLHKAYYPRKKKQNVSALTLWRWLEKLEKIGNLKIESNNKYSIVTIMNWDTYQNAVARPEQQPEQQLNNSRTTDEQQLNTNKNEENVKKTHVVDIEQSFHIFYKNYPKKKSPDQAKKTWIKLSKKKDFPSLQIILSAIENQKQSKAWKKDNGQFIPHPSTWLNNGGWGDEVDSEQIIKPPEYMTNEIIKERLNHVS